MVLKLVRLLGVPVKRIERRRHRRLRADVDVVLSGGIGQCAARAVDINRRGMGVIANQAVALDTLVFVRLPKLGLMGFAFARRCTMMTDGSYQIGLQFREALARDEKDAFLPSGWNYRNVAYAGAWSAADDR